MKAKTRITLALAAFMLGVYTNLLQMTFDGSWRCTAYNVKATVSDVVSCHGIEAFGVDMASLPSELR